MPHKYIVLKCIGSFKFTKLHEKINPPMYVDYINILNKYILNIYDLVWLGLVGFYGISTIVGHLLPNLLYTCILDISDLVWFGFKAYHLL